MRYRLECLANRYVFKSLLNCWSRQLDPSDKRAVNSRLLVRLQKKHGSQRCRVELVELTVVDVWQIADAGDQELHFNVATQYNGGRPATLLSLSPLLNAYYIGRHTAAAAGAAAAAALLRRCCNAALDSRRMDGETSEHYWVLDD